MSVRLRVTLAFALVMALVLGGTGLFLYLRLAADLDDAIERNLETRAGVFSTGGEDTIAQVLDASGRIVQTSEEASEPLLTAAQVQRALDDDDFTLDREVDDEDVRLLATPVDGQVVVVGESLENREEAVESLGSLLLVGGPLALLLAALAGYAATAAALRPVERMRARAAAIEASAAGARLPVPDTHDEIRRLGDTLNAMLDRIEAAFARERTFVADASHELRTPLSILKAELELALSRGRSKEELTEALQSAAEETDRLVALAEDLLVIARSDQGRLPIRREDLRVADVLQRVRDRHAPEASIEVADGLVVNADRLRLEQAIGNLLDNAVRHGGAHVALAAEARGESVRLHVRDDGPGFPDGLAAFERFTRGDSARGRGGAGLGLAIVDAVARAHGGRAGADGADVWIDVPR